MLSPSEVAACHTLIGLALAEDWGPVGDRTSQALLPAELSGRAAFVSRAAGVVAGLPVVELVWRAVSPRIVFTPQVVEGAEVAAGTMLAQVAGPLSLLWSGERLALNFLQRLSGIASLTRRFVAAVAGTRARIFDTRKTTPGWRLLEKYAVRQGGGHNHRLGLYDGFLIKDNHLAALGGGPQAIQRAVAAARAAHQTLWVEVEVDCLADLEAALHAHPDLILLDNFSLEALREAVRQRDRLAPRVLLEASGGITLETVAAVAATGVERISVGSLTHSAPALDIALDYLETCPMP
jgi:nicotinate-nucleotide pyrophosphorylase (carboxylating)